MRQDFVGSREMKKGPVRQYQRRVQRTASRVRSAGHNSGQLSRSIPLQERDNAAELTKSLAHGCNQDSRSTATAAQIVQLGVFPGGATRSYPQFKAAARNVQ